MSTEFILPSSPIHSLVAVFLGVIAGFIDAIAGGGGLITLPTLSLLVGAGPHAIGSNKIVGASGALTALWVYSRGRSIEWKRSLVFTAWIGIGSIFGSLCTPHIPQAAFKVLLYMTCPLILWVTWKKELWLNTPTEPLTLPDTLPDTKKPTVVWPGLICGFYDGAWGPGGGTFMLLSLLFGARIPLLSALAASKFANAVSASAALATYSLGGFVHWRQGLIVASGMIVGAFLGARHATRRAASIVRPVLVIVVLLLLAKIIWMG